MKTLFGLAAIAAALSLLALPAAAAGGGHRGHSDVQHSLNRATMPMIAFQARDLRDHGLGRDRGRTGRHEYGRFRTRGKHHAGHRYGRFQGYHNHGDRRRLGAKRHNRAVVFNFGFAAPAVAYGRPRHFARRPLPAYVIRDRLHRLHYSRLGPIYFERGRYHLRARTGRGARVKLVIHAGSGAIVRRTYLR